MALTGLDFHQLDSFRKVSSAHSEFPSPKLCLAQCFDYPQVFPKRHLLVIGGTEFRSMSVKGITLHQFLLSDGFPHPYPGQVDNPDIDNDFSRFE